MSLNSESKMVAAETQENMPQTKGKTGRPIGATKLKISDEIIKQIEGLARIQCTQPEAAAVLGVCVNTFRAFLDAHQKAREAWENGKETGKASLRRHQFKMAESNPTMAIWLGKQCLDQKDRHEVKSDITFQRAEELTDAELAAIAADSSKRAFAEEEGEDIAAGVC